MRNVNTVIFERINVTLDSVENLLDNLLIFFNRTYFATIQLTENGVRASIFSKMTLSETVALLLVFLLISLSVLVKNVV